MPHIDGRTGEVVIRIVYDGAPEAGKTTNVRQLASSISLQRRGATQSPGTSGERTEFFDWLDFSGGYLDGRRVRCQLVSVPGQSSLLHRRKYLLRTADAVVYVADSRPSLARATSEGLGKTIGILDSFASRAPVGIILQANKQDLPDVLSPIELGQTVGVPNATPIVGSVAARGEGVMQTFVIAVRLATDRVRALMGEDGVGELAAEQLAPEGLYEAMKGIEPPPEPPSPEAEATPNEPAQERVDVVATRAAEPRRVNGARRIDDVTLPTPHDVPAGLVWPPVSGRAALATAVGGALSAPNEVRGWAPLGAIEITSSEGWLLHSSMRWAFATESEARLGLHAIVRRALPWIDHLPASRAFLVSRDRSTWRMWMLTTNVRAIAERLTAALATRDPATLERELGVAVRLERALLETGVDAGSGVPGGASGVGYADGRIVLLPVDEGESQPALATRSMLGDLRALLRNAATTEGWVDAWLREHESRLPW